ncbi:MAG TPA: UpxY family transcription antiterminator [Phnomibacter sp.]|nr:UpxY family transcription antiterminator [Phnomibacter sp.]
MSETPKHWYALYTRSRWEKKVDRLLTEAGYETYCPLNKVERRWSDRIKKVEEPLFRSYVFVHIEPAKQSYVRAIEGVVNFVYYLGKAAIVRDEEIEAIRLFLGEHDNVEVTPLDGPIAPGTRLRITSGFMMDKQAIAVKEHNKFVEVIIESIGFRLRASVERRRLEKV